jgi:hypothetical protein
MRISVTQYPRFYTRQSDLSGFAQDNWRVNRRLTLNISLRYEYWTPFRDKRSQVSDLISTIRATLRSLRWFGFYHKRGIPPVGIGCLYGRWDAL